MPTNGHTSGIKRFGSDEKRAEQSALRRRKTRDRRRRQISLSFRSLNGNEMPGQGRSDNSDEMLARAVVFGYGNGGERPVLLCLSAARLVRTASWLASLPHRRTGSRTR